MQVPYILKINVNIFQGLRGFQKIKLSLFDLCQIRHIQLIRPFNNHSLSEIDRDSK